MRTRPCCELRRIGWVDADIRRRLEAVLAELPVGDSVRGMRVFHSQRAACGACHEIGYVGGRVGPDSTGIGKTGTQRYLVQAIVFPNARIAQGYRSTQVLTTDGTVHTGIVRSEDDQQLTLIIEINRTVSSEQDEIELRKPSSMSTVPAGLDGAMTLQDLADVTELLKTYRVW